MSVYSTKGKGWRYDFKLNGRRYTGAWFKTKRKATESEEERRKEVLKPEEVESQTPTDMAFLELVNHRLDFVQAFRSDHYYQDTCCMARRWVVEWDGRLCGEFTQEMIESFLMKRAKVSHYAANMDLKLLRALFNHGIKRRFIRGNPTTGVEFFPVEKRIKYVPPAEDVRRLIWSAEKDDRDYLIVIAETMARVGEVNRLVWDDVDFRERTVVLYTRKKRGGHLTPRKVPMTDLLYRTLHRRFEQRDQAKPWVFWHRYKDKKKGVLVEGPYLRRKRFLKSLCEKVGVRPIGFHALRHSGASILEHANVSISTIQRLLGHENRTTTEIYLHSLGQPEREAIRIFEGLREKSHTESHTEANDAQEQSA